MMQGKHIHFVGFRGDEYNRARRVWGTPDFIHAWHDHRMYGDVDTDVDIIIFANGECEDHIHKWTWQDHENW